MVALPEAAQTSHSNSARTELHKLKEGLVATHLVAEEMKNGLYKCKKSEAQAQELVSETLKQLDLAKKMVKTLRSDGCKATEAYDAAASELEQSRARIKHLEELVSKLKSEAEERRMKESSEVEQLKSALARSQEQMKQALEMVEQIKSASGQREAELEAELRRCSYEIEELRSNTQRMFEENDSLVMQLENALPSHRKHEMEKEIHGLKAEIKNMQALLKEKETMKSEMSEAFSKMEAARAAEREAEMKVGCMTEEVEKSNRKAGRVVEQLEAAQAANAEMEAELRRLKVQSDQWRKAAEVAASMLNKGRAVERTGSMDNPGMRRGGSPFVYEVDDDDDDVMKKKNVTMLTRFGVLWKK